MRQVTYIKTPTASTVMIEGVGSFTADDALQVAAHLVFLVGGNLCDGLQDGKITKWNTKAAFFDEYRKIMESPR